MRRRIHENPVIKNCIEFKELSEETKGTRTVAEITLQSGGKVPAHYHNEFSEYYEVLEGELNLQIGKKTKMLRQGEYALVPVKVNHSYYNSSGKAVRFKVIIQPGNVGYQLLVAALNGMARDRLVNRSGLPTNLYVFGFLAVASGSNIPGVKSLLQPLLRWLYKRAIRKGLDKQILS